MQYSPKEVGGYLELEKMSGSQWHSGLALNSARNCLRLFLREKQIKRLLVPYYVCDCVFTAAYEENCELRFYHLSPEFIPESVSLMEDEYIFIVNLYGLLTNETIQSLKEKYQRIILDNTHAFFLEPIQNIPTIYNCRKFFGVPDGGYLYSDIAVPELSFDHTAHRRIMHIAGRLEQNASDFYTAYREAEATFEHAEVCYMSPVTSNLLCGIDYLSAKEQRESNYRLLFDHLKEYNELSLNRDLAGPFSYPFKVPKGQELRKKMINDKIFIPCLWPNVMEDSRISAYERDCVENILPIPCDQRYNTEDMMRIIYKVFEYYSK